MISESWSGGAGVGGCHRKMWLRREEEGRGKVEGRRSGLEDSGGAYEGVGEWKG